MSRHNLKSLYLQYRSAYQTWKAHGVQNNLMWPRVQKVVWLNGLNYFVGSHHFVKFSSHRLCRCSDAAVKPELVLQKMHSFFFCQLQLITVLRLIRDSYTSWSTRFVTLKLCVGFSIFHCILFLWKFIFLFNKM